MKRKGVLICDFSGVYEDEGFLLALRERNLAYLRLDFRGIEGTECYCDDASVEKIKGAIAGSEELVHWIDSGDYHYMSKLFAERLTESFTLVLLDNHPDDQKPGFGEILSCGGWVRDLKRCSDVLERVISVGPEGKLKGVEEFKEALSEASPRRIYLSLDKDVMGRDYARTNWNQGEMSLDEVKEIIGLVFRSGAEVLGIDVCGELTEAKGAKAEDYAVNLRTNIELHEFISDYLN